MFIIPIQPLSLPDLIARFPEQCKVCKQCNTVQPLRYGCCVNCGAYRFSTDRQSVLETLEKVTNPAYVSTIPEYEQ